MPKISKVNLPTEIEKLKGKCNTLDKKMTKVMAELLEELEHQNNHNSFSDKVKQGLKEISDKKEVISEGA